MTGDLFNWINSDDYLEEGALFKIADAYTKNPSKKVFCFSLYNESSTDKTIFPHSNDPANEWQCYCNPAINQQSTFYTMEAVKTMGPVNSSLHYAMDYEWWLKFIFNAGANAIYTDKEMISTYRMHEESKSSLYHERFLNDIATILYSVSGLAGREKWPPLLSERFTISHDYSFSSEIRSFPFLKKEMLDRMIVFFLLKWSRQIYGKPHFIFAKKLIREVDFTSFDLTDMEKQWFQQLCRLTRAETWLGFRIQRKLKERFNL